MKITRREAMAGLSATVLSGYTAGLRAAEPAAAANVPGIDAHTHFYDPTRKQGVPWPDKNDAKLYRTVLPGEFQKLAGPFGIKGTIVVEASAWVEDNQWVLDLAAENPVILGVVGHLTPGTPEFAGQVKRFARNPLYRGIRVNYETEAKSGPMLGADLARLVDADLSLDLNGPPAIVHLAAGIAQRHPELRIVINHLGNLQIDGKAPPEAWAADMKAAAAHPNVYCKASACVEGARGAGPPPAGDRAFYRPVLDVAWDCFGPDRLMYASNWPVSALFADYQTVYRIAANYIADKGPEASAKFFHHNAVGAYRCKTR